VLMPKLLLSAHGIFGYLVNLDYFITEV